ncbi:helix-turn-helix domain-containing protein [Streptomyces sp. PmtG]
MNSLYEDPDLHSAHLTARDLIEAIPSLVAFVLDSLKNEEDIHITDSWDRPSENRRKEAEDVLAMALTRHTQVIADESLPLESPCGDSEHAHTLTGERERPDKDPRDARQRLLDTLVSEGRVPTRLAQQLLRPWGQASPPRNVQPVAIAPARWAMPLPSPSTTAVSGDMQSSYRLLPDPTPETRRALLATLQGRMAAVGPTVPLDQVGTSMRWARQLLRLARECHSARAGVLYVEEHLPMLLLLQDEQLLRLLAARCLAPLHNMTRRQNERLSSTLLAWLQTGNATEAAKALNVHSQTVRYRMKQVERIFHASLRDTDERFALLLALRSRSFAFKLHREDLNRRERSDESTAHKRSL